MQKITFLNSKGQNICGVISGPRSENAILICHGLGGSKDIGFYRVLQEKINNLGIDTFSIDLLGHGESDGEYEDLTLTEAIDDVMRARDELRRRGYKDIGFIGSSFGAVSGLIAASHEQFAFLVLISPPTYYDFKDVLKNSLYVLSELRRFRQNKNDDKKAGLTVRFFWDYSSHDSYDAALKVESPVLIIQGSEDRIVPCDKSIGLHKRLKHSRMKIFVGADHEYTGPVATERLLIETMKYVEERVHP